MEPDCESEIEYKKNHCFFFILVLKFLDIFIGNKILARIMYEMSAAYQRFFLLLCILEVGRSVWFTSS